MKSNKKNATLHAVGMEWLENEIKPTATGNTADVYRRDLNLLVGHFGGDRMLDNILPQHVGMFLKSDALNKGRNGDQRAQPTIDRTVRVLKFILRYAETKGYVEKAPLPKSVAERKKRTPRETTVPHTVVYDPNKKAKKPAGRKAVGAAA